MLIKNIIQSKLIILLYILLVLFFLICGLLINKIVICILPLVILVVALIVINDTFGIYLILIKNLFFGFLISMFSIPNQINYIEDVAILTLLIKWLLSKKIILPQAFRKLFVYFLMIFFGFTTIMAFNAHFNLVGFISHQRLFIRFFMLIIVFSNLQLKFLNRILKLCYWSLLFQLPLVLYQYIFIVVLKKIDIPPIWVGNTYLNRTLNDFVGGIFGYNASDVLGILSVICFLGTIIYLSLNSKNIGYIKKIFFSLSCLIFLFMPLLCDAKIALLLIPFGILIYLLSRENIFKKSLIVLYLICIIVIGISISGLTNISFGDTINNFIASAQSQFEHNDMIQRGESLVYTFGYLSKKDLFLLGDGMGSHFSSRIRFMDYRIGIYNYQASYLLIEIGLIGSIMALVLLIWIPILLYKRTKTPENNDEILVLKIFYIMSYFSIIIFFYTNFFYDPYLTFFYCLITAMAIRFKWRMNNKTRGCEYGNISNNPFI